MAVSKKHEKKLPILNSRSKFYALKLRINFGVRNKVLLSISQFNFQQ